MPVVFFNPDPATAARILNDLSDPARSLCELAAEHDTTLESLSLWISLPETQDRLATIDSVALQRTRLVAAQHLAPAAKALGDLIADHNQRRDTTDPLRAASVVLRASSLLLRLSRLSPPPRGRGQGGGLTDTAPTQPTTINHAHAPTSAPSPRTSTPIAATAPLASLTTTQAIVAAPSHDPAPDAAPDPHNTAAFDTADARLAELEAQLDAVADGPIPEHLSALLQAIAAIAPPPRWERGQGGELNDEAPAHLSTPHHSPRQNRESS